MRIIREYADEAFAAIAIVLGIALVLGLVDTASGLDVWAGVLLLFSLGISLRVVTSIQTIRQLSVALNAAQKIDFPGTRIDALVDTLDTLVKALENVYSNDGDTT